MEVKPMQETKKMERPEKKVIKVTVDGHDSHQEFEGTAVFVLAMKDDADGKGVFAGSVTEGWFNDHYLVTMQKILEKNFPRWDKVKSIHMMRELMKQMYGDDEGEEDAEASEPDPAE